MKRILKHLDPVCCVLFVVLFCPGAIIAACVICIWLGKVADAVLRGIGL
jgi:hypothetical protein